MVNDLLADEDGTDDSTNALIDQATLHANQAAIDWCRSQRGRSLRADQDPPALYLAGLIEMIALALAKLPAAQSDAWLETVRRSVADERTKRGRQAH